MIRLVTYSDSKMSKSALLCCQSASKNGVEVIWPQNTDTISHEFYLMNSDILRHERGAGYWLWKPYSIYKALLNANEGDVVIYSDAGVEFVANVNEIINRMDEEIFFFTNGWPHIEWCKMDVIKAILPEFKIDGTERNIKQVQASVIFFRVSKKTRDFVKEWLLYSQVPGFIDDSPSKEPNYATFAEHRHDQSILTCLQIKYGYKTHWWPTQYSNHLPRSSEDSYPVMFNHHRKRNNEW
jgi:hypothetical protein